MYPLSDEFVAPYVVALVDLEEGVRMMSNIIGLDPSSVYIGMRVRVQFEVVSNRISLPYFTSIGDGV
jgi:hypothetical protein